MPSLISWPLCLNEGNEVPLLAEFAQGYVHQVTIVAVDLFHLFLPW